MPSSRLQSRPLARMDNSYAINIDELSCRQVAHRDPLSADAVLANLPVMNAAADLRQLATAFRELLTRAREAELPDIADRLAAMRDVGMLMSSLRRHGVEPLDAVPEAAGVLLAWGHSAGMVPRDTVLHYGAWNPRGKRQRMFLGEDQENVVLDAVRVSTLLISEIAPQLAGLAELHPDDTAFGEICHAAADQLETLPQLMSGLYRTVDPIEFYAARLRPFMADVVVADRSYYGPAAVHVPLYLIDRLVWSSDHGGVGMTYFQDDLLNYGLPRWRRMFEHTTDTESLVTRLVREFDRPDGPPSTKAAYAMDGVIRILDGLVTFRTKHGLLARAAYTDGTRYAMGIAGVSPAVLDHVLALTRRCADWARTRRKGART
ncbi:monodechloroaminopyrrolnitrin synthase PrnB family protein [Nocardia brasiliensis]|uniref:monodechloroaminopyrrolnitrin synthase PrnB family protein n=1 Tax=Nocardia brasiliensis TaxID=37326 RepID=UPI0024578D2A|nr:monodechloroaminopyrrolnitrin synthase PrnB family protein [Nocardia brasiliensis]